jgi:hypothetical protein
MDSQPKMDGKKIEAVEIALVKFSISLVIIRLSIFLINMNTLSNSFSPSFIMFLIICSGYAIPEIGEIIFRYHHLSPRNRNAQLSRVLVLVLLVFFHWSIFESDIALPVRAATYLITLALLWPIRNLSDGSRNNTGETKYLAHGDHFSGSANE